MAIKSDLMVLFQLMRRTRVRGLDTSHADRLEDFYQGQAEGYDGFRARLLHGREELIKSLPFEKHPGGIWLDIGAGTGFNLQSAFPKASVLKKIYLLDLCPSLLKIAETRIEKAGWENVVTVHGDAETFVPEEGTVDFITLSYSLSMITNWMSVVDHALKLLKPAGTLAIVDFYVSRKFELAGETEHNWWTRTFWPIWFSFDNVFLRPDVRHYLKSRLKMVEDITAKGPIPYVPLGEVPYFRFIGEKRKSSTKK